MIGPHTADLAWQSMILLILSILPEFVIRVVSSSYTERKS